LQYGGCAGVLVVENIGGNRDLGATFSPKTSQTPKEVVEGILLSKNSILEEFYGTVEVRESLLLKSLVGMMMWAPLSVLRVPGHPGKWKVNKYTEKRFWKHFVLRWRCGSVCCQNPWEEL
jgi:hypothetical protein